MRIITARPPNFSEILQAFPMAANSGVIFSYAPDIYAPSGRDLPPELLDHESVHIKRQIDMGVEAWWKYYLIDDEFRYNEELLAHQAEYKKLCEMYTDRRSRRSSLKYVAKKLSAPLYGRMISFQQAQEDILNG